MDFIAVYLYAEGKSNLVPENVTSPINVVLASSKDSSFLRINTDSPFI